jgi:PAS domain S-box-containing protein
VTAAERILEVLSDGVFTLDQEGRVAFWNASMERLVGVTRDSIIGEPLFAMFPSWRGEAEHVERARAGAVVVSPTFLGAPEARRYEATYQALDADVMVVIRDVTSTQETLSEVNARFQLMADTSPVLLWIAGTDGLCTYFNQRWLEFSGRPLERELGNGWAEGVHPEDFSRCMDIYLDAFVARESFRMEYRLRRADGVYRWLLDTGVPRFLPRGEFAGFIGSCIDVTDSRLVRNDLDRLVRERTAELEAFAYSVSHDLRAPLRGIDGFSHALLEDYGDRLGIEGRDHLDRVRKAAQRMARLIDDLLQLSRISRGELRATRCDLTGLARTTFRMLREREPGRVVELVVAEGLVVTADAQLLEIALDNLVGNAWKFTANTPNARIELLAELVGTEIVITVRDNGAGFDMAYAAKLFLPFQRLHTATEFPGTGIGLATVARIVRRHDGRVWATGAVDSGATFHVALPQAGP